MAALVVGRRLCRHRAGGAVAQLGERRNRTAEVRGSNPLGSTKPVGMVLDPAQSPSCVAMPPMQNRIQSRCDSLRSVDRRYGGHDERTARLHCAGGEPESMALT